MTEIEKSRIIFRAILEWKRTNSIGLTNSSDSLQSFYEVISKLCCSPLIYGEVCHQQDFDYLRYECGFDFTEDDISSVLSQPLKNFI